MLLLIVFIALFILGICLFIFDNDYSGWDFLGGLLSIASGIGLIIMVVAYFDNRADDRIFIKRFEQFNITLQQARGEDVLVQGQKEMERVNVFSDIQKYNSELIELQYWRSSNWVGVFGDKAVLDLKPIK